ncbi:MAG TPA: GNAT family N-acetyltransferase [Anaeromyxobacteraceae bacterium]|nr:GNAT family N-acetyltransferase [Anaeromyxobacteraceae bacterium]
MVPLEVHVRSTLSDVPAAEWDRLWAHEPDAATPFLSHAWLDAVEQCGAATPERGWAGRHLLLRRGGRVVAALPAWARTGSDGDFGRDWEWAAAAERAGIPYYPKLVVGVPFTPATGRRLLVAPGEDRAAMARVAVEALLELCDAEGIRSVHVLHLPEEDARELEAAGLALRADFQFHWRNDGYRDFDDFLARFPSRRRNAIRRERAAPAAQGIAIRTVRGDELSADPAGWARDVARLHGRSVERMAWGMRFLGRSFFERVLRSMPGAIEVVEARRGGLLAGMAFNVASASALYGRYWGAAEDHPFLHFNVALYHSVEECIRLGRRVFEGGAGGEHKLSRGFEPALVWSAHRFLDPRLEAPLRRHLAATREGALAGLERWRAESAVLRPRDAGAVRPSGPR